MGNIADLFLFDEGLAKDNANNYYTDKLIKNDPVKICGLGELSRVNIFVGANNSGKSRFMRKLMNEDALPVNSDIHFSKTQFKNYYSTKETIDLNTNRQNIERYFGYPEENILVSGEITSEKTVLYLGNYINTHFSYSKQDKIAQIIKRDKPIFSSLNGADYIYIPLLRSVNPISENINNENGESKEDIYAKYVKKNVEGLERFNLALGPNKGNQKYIFTGQSIYSELQNKLLGNWEERDQVKEYEEFISEKLFGNQKIELIPKLKDNTVSVRIGNQIERELYKLGDGVQAVILLTFMMYIHKDRRLLFFIEEPEINMHPGLQRLILEVMLDESLGEQQYFFTTHSNHFLDMTIDHDNISVFNFKQINSNENQEKNVSPKFRIKKTAPNDIDILNSLGVNNSSVFLANCTIWVEGITDVIYLRAYIDKYIDYHKEKEFQEDIHYAFVTYGGSCINNWDFDSTEDSDKIFAEALNKSIFLIADGDNDTKTKRDERMENELGDYYYKTNAKEIENIMHYKLLIEIISTIDVPSAISKNEFYDKLIRKYEENSGDNETKNDLYIHEPIGEYIENLLESLNYNDHQRFKSESGSLYSSKKMKFAELASNKMKEMDYDSCMSKEAIELSENIIEFIKKNNS